MFVMDTIDGIAFLVTSVTFAVPIELLVEVVSFALLVVVVLAVLFVVCVVPRTFPATILLV